MQAQQKRATKLPLELCRRFDLGRHQLARLRGPLMAAGLIPATKRGAGARGHTPRDAAALMIVLALEATPTTAADELRSCQELVFRGFAHGHSYFIDGDAGDAAARMAVRDALDVLAAIVDRGRGRRRERLVELLQHLLSDEILQNNLAAISENFERLGGGVTLNINLLGGAPCAEVAFGAHIACEHAAVCGFGAAIFADARDPRQFRSAPRVRGQITLDDLLAVGGLMQGDSDGK